MNEKRIDEISQNIADQHPAAPVTTDVFELQELLRLARKGLQADDMASGMKGILVKVLDQDDADVRVAAFAEDRAMAETVANAFHAAYPLARLYVHSKEYIPT